MVLKQHRQWYFMVFNQTLKQITNVVLNWFLENNTNITLETVTGFLCY